MSTRHFNCSGGNSKNIKEILLNYVVCLFVLFYPSFIYPHLGSGDIIFSLHPKFALALGLLYVISLLGLLPCDTTLAPVMRQV